MARNRADVDALNTGNPRLTGVWKSWDIKATSPPASSAYGKTERDKKFLGWLTSSIDGNASNVISFAKTAPTTPVTLWGKGSLGINAPASDLVSATKVTVSPSRGGFAYAVMDEGVKVRINTPYVDETGSKGMQTTQLGSGERPNASSIQPISGLKSDFYQNGSASFGKIENGISRLNFGLTAEALAVGTGALLKPLSHDITPYSVGLFTDTAIGGIKEDLSLLTNSAALPTAYQKGIYESRLGLSGASAPSDPRWESLHDYARIYQDTSRLSTNSGAPVVNAKIPTGWAATNSAGPDSGTPGTLLITPPKGVVICRLSPRSRFSSLF